MGEVFSR